MNETLKIGQVVNNKTLYRSFKVANSGGMRRNINDNLMVLTWNSSNKSVANRWEGDTLHYVGQGDGDQKLTRNNLTLSTSRQSGKRSRQRAATRNLVWGFNDEEVAIDAGDDRSRVQEVLDIIGCGDEFESIVNQAMIDEPMPESPPAFGEGPVQNIDDVVRPCWSGRGT